MEIPKSVYSQLCTCKRCNRTFLSLFEYGFHVFQVHNNLNISNTNITGVKDFISGQILNQLQNIDYYNQLQPEDQRKFFSSVKKSLREETEFPLSLVLPDGKKKKRKPKSRSKRKRKNKSKSRRKRSKSKKIII